MSNSRSQSGFSLIEVVLFIVIVGIGLAGILALYSQLNRASVDPAVRKQALAIASSLMDEVQLKAFTFCDPDDAANVYTAASPAGCDPSKIEGIGPETFGTTETRTSATAPFDNVSDYHGFAMAAGAIADASGTVVPGLASYSVSVTVAQAALDVVAATESLLVTVTAVHVLSGTSVVLQGYRMRYAPNSP